MQEFQIGGTGNGIVRFSRWRMDDKLRGDLRLSGFNIDVQRRILTLVKALLKESSVVVEVLPESRLASIGMTSVDMVDLMLGVEAEFDLTISQREITPKISCRLEQ